MFSSGYILHSYSTVIVRETDIGMMMCEYCSVILSLVYICVTTTAINTQIYFTSTKITLCYSFTVTPFLLSSTILNSWQQLVCFPSHTFVISIVLSKWDDTVYDLEYLFTYLCAIGMFFTQRNPSKLWCVSRGHSFVVAG